MIKTSVLLSILAFSVSFETVSAENQFFPSAKQGFSLSSDFNDNQIPDHEEVGVLEQRQEDFRKNRLNRRNLANRLTILEKRQTNLERRQAQLEKQVALLLPLLEFAYPAGVPIESQGRGSTVDQN